MSADLWTADLWAEASFDHEGASRQAAADRASAELADVMPFFLASRSPAEYEHRRALASDRLISIAMRAGLTPEDLAGMADRQMSLYFEALAEGTDPLANIEQATHPQGAGPEKPDEHTETTDLSGHYSEIPPGVPGGPPPQVVTPQFGRPQAPEEVTAARKSCSCGSGLTGAGKCKGCSKKPGKCQCDSQAGMIRQSSLSRLGQDASTIPAGAGGPGITPDGLPPGGVMPAPSPPPSGLAGSGQSGMNVSPGDPYNIQVTSVARSILSSNPHLPEREARRVARQVVGSYLRHADLNSSVISDDYGSGNTSAPAGQSGGNLAEHLLEGRGLRSMIPGGGTGEAGAAAGGAADLAELAPLALA